MECLDEETILAFCGAGSRELAAGARALALEHIGTCDECRQLVSAVARSSFVHPEEREDAPRGALLRGRFDPAMAPTTPVDGSGPPGPSASPVHPGQILAGKFEVERVLGHGGMGIVVAARHTQLEQRVALKFLLPVACEVPGAVSRFLREGKAAARITSEHVARVIDTGVLEGGAPYLVMEYLEGSDLGQVLQQRGRIAPDVAIEYVLQACEAIVEAHELGVVHRDLKPANLFLSRRADGSPLVKVLDFGISKVEGRGSRSQLTSASVLMGSPRYMSPEQMLSAKDVDARTDVWALGVILFELVTGKPVWNADTMQGLCALIATAPAPSLRDVMPGAPVALDEAIARCLAKSRDARLVSIAELALALEPIAPASARTSIDRILRVGRRDRDAQGAPRSIPVAPGVSAAPAGGAAGAHVGSAEATTSSNRKDAPGRLGIILGVAVFGLLVAGIAVNAALARRPADPPPSKVEAAVTPAPVASSSAVARLPSAASAGAVLAALSAAVESPPASSSVASVASVAFRRPVRPTPIASTAPALGASTGAVAPSVRPEPRASASSEPSRALTDRK
jgi:serine/threonine-protein kinase